MATPIVFPVTGAAKDMLSSGQPGDLPYDFKFKGVDLEGDPGSLVVAKGAGASGGTDRVPLHSRVSATEPAGLTVGERVLNSLQQASAEARADWQRATALSAPGPDGIPTVSDLLKRQADLAMFVLKTEVVQKTITSAARAVDKMTSGMQ
jgi:hypothetical protein